MTDEGPGPQRRGRARGGGTWVFVVGPALIVGLIVAAVAIATRPADDDGAERLGGPAAELPAVVEAAAALFGAAPPPAERAEAIGRRTGEIGLGLVEIDDETDFAARFDRLPPAEAKLLGQLLGAIQRELSPTAIGGPRGDGDRSDDMAFAVELVWAAAPVLDAAAPPEQQALNVLPASVPLADDGDAIVAAVVAADYAGAAALLDPVLSEAGAAEIVSGLAGDISDRVGQRNDDVRLREFQDAYNLQIP